MENPYGGGVTLREICTSEIKYNDTSPTSVGMSWEITPQVGGVSHYVYLLFIKDFLASHLKIVFCAAVFPLS